MCGGTPEIAAFLAPSMTNFVSTHGLFRVPTHALHVPMSKPWLTEPPSCEVALTAFYTFPRPGSSSDSDHLKPFHCNPLPWQVGRLAATCQETASGSVALALAHHPTSWLTQYPSLAISLPSGSQLHLCPPQAFPHLAFLTIIPTS